MPSTSRIERTLITLAMFHYELGMIDISEFEERVQIADWLCDETGLLIVDPREILESDQQSDNEFNEHNYNEAVVVAGGRNSSENSDELWKELLCLGVWVFTKSDPDPYPSVPHGHFKNQNNKWPKLNPYSGRVFKAKHQEDKIRRLNKKQMKDIWTDQKFRSFCREMIVWYREAHQHYVFPVRRPLKMPTWE